MKKLLGLFVGVVALLATAIAADVELSWNYPGTPAPDFKGYVVVTGNVGDPVTEADATQVIEVVTNKVTVANLDPGYYWFYVRASTTNNVVSEPSAVIMASVPLAPVDLGITGGQ